MTPSDPKFESWGVDESPIAIDYSLVVIEEIRHEVAQGLQRFSRGGLEVGGILYGTREGRKVRILAMRPIECEHKQGPSFLLSDIDKAGLEQQIREEQQDPNLNGLICVGWFVSHTRGEISMTEADQEIFSAFFANPWQVTLIVRPGRSGSMRAAFFVWENDGTVQTEHSYKEFNFPDRLAGVFDRPRGATRGGGEQQRLGFRSGGSPIPIPTRHDAVPHHPAAVAQTPVFEASNYMPVQEPERKKWPWIVAILVLLLVTGGILGMRYYAAPAVPDPLQLVIIEQSGQLQVQWNPVARPVQQSVRGFLEFVDGGEAITIPLTRQDLETGKYQYIRRTGDVEVRLVAEDADSQLTSERSHFVGRPPEAPDNEELKALETKRDELQAEVDQLKRENAAQAARLRQLDVTIRVLQSRLGITQ